MNRRWLPWLLIAAAALLFAPLCRPLAREVVLIPLLYLLWLLKFLFDAVPQTVIWPLLVLLLFLILAAGLTGGRRQRRRRSAPPPARPAQRVAEWAQLIEQANNDGYFKWRLGQQLQKVMLRLVAEQRQQTIAETRQQLRRGDIDLPPEVLAYFQASLRPLGSLPSTRSWQFWRRPAASPLDLEPAQLIATLEHMNDGERGNP